MRFRITPLEERIVLDAAGAIDILHSYHLEQVYDSHESSKSIDFAEKPALFDSEKTQSADKNQLSSLSEGLNIDSPYDSSETHVLVVSTAIKNPDILTEAAKDSTLVILYDPNTTSLTQLANRISNILQGKQADSIAFASEGMKGTFSLTSDITVSLETLNSNPALQDFWTTVGGVIKDGGRIDLLSCNVGSTAEGRALIAQMDTLVDYGDKDVSIAASTDYTGSKGDWNLEIGNVDASQVYFSNAIHQWDGDLGTPVKIGGTLTTVANLKNVNGVLLFSATGSSGNELYKYNPSTDSSPVLVDINAGAGNSNPTNFYVSSQGILYFSATNGVNGVEPYKYDPSTGVATQLADIHTSGDSTPLSFVEANNKIYFSATRPAEGRELWSYDPSNGNVAIAADIQAGTTGSTPLFIVTMGGDLYFSAVRTTTGAEPYMYDTDTGTVTLLKDVRSGTLGSSPSQFNVVGSKVFFAANDGPTSANELYVTDGTAANTVRVADIAPGSTSALLSGSGYAVVDNYLYFTAIDGANGVPGTHGLELWRTDGTTTTLVKDFIVGTSPNSSETSLFPSNLTSINGLLYLSAGDSTSGNLELWKSDPVTNTTTLVANINPSGSSSPTGISSVNGIIFFSANDGTNGRELWSYNPTTGQTQMVNNLNPLGDGIASNFSSAVIGSKLFFAGNDGPGATLWYYEESQPITDIQLSNSSIAENEASGHLIGNFTATDPNSGATSTFTLVSGTGSTDNSHFSIVDNSLYANESFNFEAKSSYSIRVRDTNSVGIVFEKVFTITVSNVYEAAVAVDDTVSVNQDGSVTKNVLANDANPDNATLATVLDTVAAHGTVVHNVDGSFTYTPDAGYYGSDSFTYKIDDGTQLSNAATVTVSINATPLAVDDSYSTTNIGMVRQNVLANDSDPDSGSLSSSLVSGPSHGELTLNSDGSFIYYPDAGYVGSDSFVYHTTDGSATSSDATVSITISDQVANAPFLIRDIVEGFGASSPSNFTYVNGDVNTTFFVAYDAAHGYELWKTDGTAKGTVLVKDINLGSSSSAPSGLVNVNGTLYFAVEDGVHHGRSIWKSDGTDAGTTFVYNTTPGPVNSIAANPQNLTSVNGRLVFTADRYEAGVGSTGIWLWTSDGTTEGTTALSAPGSLPNNIQDPHFADFTIGPNGLLFYTAEDNMSHGKELWVSDGASYANMLKDIYPGLSASNPSHLTLFGNTLFFTADDGVHGTELWMSDGTENGTHMVFNIVEEQTATPLSSNPSNLIDANGMLYFSATDASGDTELWTSSGDGTFVALVANINTAGSSDLSNFHNHNEILYFSAHDASGITQLWRSDPYTGTYAVTNQASDFNPYGFQTVDETLYFLVNDGTHGIELWRTNGLSTGTSLVTDINPGSLSAFTPTSELSLIGSTLLFGANDGTNGTELWALNFSETIPVANNDQYSTNEDTALTIPNSSGGVLLNDTDADGNSHYASLSQTPSHGQLFFNPEGGFTYIPDPDYYGEDSFTYFIDDDFNLSNEATVTITVVPVAEGLQSVSDQYNVDEDAALDVTAQDGLLANDSLTEGAYAVLDTGPSHGTLTFNADGSFSYTPEADFNGTDSFTYYLTDGSENSLTSTVTIDVASINDTPVAVDDHYTVAEDSSLNLLFDLIPGVLANDYDADGDTFSIHQLSTTSHGFLNLFADGRFIYTPDADFYGTDSFTYLIVDSLVESNTGTVTIEVTNVNDAPTASDDSYATDEDTPLHISAASGVLSNDNDIDSTLTAVLDAGPSHGTLTLNADGSFDYNPDANYQGSDSFTYHATDGSLDSDVKTVSIEIAAVNDAPTAVNDHYTVAEDSSLNLLIGSLPGILANDFDVDGDSFTLVQLSTTTHGSLSLFEDGRFIYTPDADFYGTDSFTYALSDASNEGNVGTVTIDVTNVNDAPVAEDDSYNATEDTTLNVSAANGVLSNDSDIDSSITAVLDSEPSHGSLTLNADGSFNYTPAANFNGTDSFTYHATDGSIDTDIKTVTIQIAAVNDDPVAINDSYEATEDTTLTVNAINGVLKNDSDVDSSLTAVLDSGPSHGSLTLNEDGSFSYTPSANYNGTDSFTYHATDGSLNSEIKTVTIQIGAVNDAPVAVNDTYEATEDTILTVNAANGVLSNDSDVDSSITAVLDSGPAHGSLTLNTDGSFSYTPDANYNGTDSFTYYATDGSLDSEVKTVTIQIGAVNDVPIAVEDSYEAAEDATLNISAANGVLSNDSDVDSSLTVVLDDGPAHGSLILNSDGSFSYTPAENYNGTDSFTYHATDGSLDSAIKTVTIEIAAVNDAPDALNDSYNATEDTILTVDAANGVLSNDSDIDSSITAILDSEPEHGSLTLNADGSFSYTPSANYNGSDSFTYHATDGGLDSEIKTVTIQIAAVNDTPIALEDSYIATEDTTLTVDAANGVLSNDSDIDSSMTAVLDSGPAHGTLTLNADGGFSYTPAENYNGTDSFTYHATDGSLDSAIKTVTIEIAAVNDAPDALNDSYNATEDTILTVDAANGVLSNDSDIDSSITAILDSEPEHGSLTLNADGSFSYTPSANYNGSDTFTYHATDGSLNSEVKTVTIQIAAVNDTPIALEDSYIATEDTTLTVDAANGALSNDSDVDSSMTAILDSGPAHGTLTLNADGSFSYTPSANYNGNDSFTYHATDGSFNSEIKTVTIQIAAVNDTPIALEDSYIATEDTTLTVDATNGVLSNDSDIDSSMTAILDSGPIHGTLTFNADGSFSYTPSTNYNGSDSFTYHATDGSLDSAIKTVTIEIAAVNDAPIALSDSYDAAEDTTLTVDAANGVLSNDSDVDSSMTAILDSGPAHGSLTLNGDGSFSYTPSTNYNGTDSFTYHATDGSLDSEIKTVTIQIAAVNDVPDALNDSYNATEDTILTVDAANGVLSNDSDVDSSITAILDSEPEHGSLTLNADGSFSYTPSANYNGSDSFTYHATDGSLDSEIKTVTIQIAAVNDAPIALEDSYIATEDTTLNVDAAIGVLSNDSDVDSSMTAVLDSGPAHGTLTLNADGSFAYTPASSYFGTDSFTYHATDGSLDSEIKTVTIAITSTNNAPVATDDSYNYAVEDTTLNVSAANGVLNNDSDVDSSITAVLDSGPAHGSLTLNADGSFSYTPAANYNGTDSFTYHATDGSLDSEVKTVTISIAAVNDAPVAVNDSYVRLEDTPFNILPLHGVLENDFDVDGDSLTAILDSGPSHGTLTFYEDGSFDYVSNANFNGTDSFTYHINDGILDSASATVQLRLIAENDAPVAENDAYSTNEDTTITVNAANGLLSNDSDVDSNITAVLDSGPAHGSLTLNSDGSFSYTPDANYNGIDSFTYHATDGSLDSEVKTVTISISAINDAPVALNDSYVTLEDFTLGRSASLGVLKNDIDVDGDSLTVILESGPSHGILTLNPDGGFHYAPDANYVGLDSFTYHATDGILDSATATVTINILNDNDAPVAENDLYNATEDTTLTVNAANGVLSNDSDIDSLVTAVLDSGPSHGTLTLNADGSFSYTPATNYNGTDSFTYHVTDGEFDSDIKTVTIQVDAVNDAPVAVNDSYIADEDTTLTISPSNGVLENDSDIDSGSLSAALNTFPAHGSILFLSDGSFSYTPAANYFGTDSFTYQVTDGTSTSTATVTIFIAGANDAPVAANDSYNATEDTILNVSAANGVLGNDSDIDSVDLTAELDTGPSHGILNLNEDGSFSYTPTAGYIGSDSFTYHVSDGGLNSNIATVTLVVSEGNTAPQAVSDLYIVQEDTPLTVSDDQGVLVNDSDAEGDPLDIIVDTSPNHGSLTMNADGSFTYTPDENFNGIDSFTYHLNDGELNSETATVTINVTAVNDLSIAGDDSYTVAEDGSLNVGSPGVLINDTDVDGDSLTAVLDVLPEHGTLILNADGSFTYIPESNYNGGDSFSYHVNDGSDDSNVATVAIHVTAVNDAPIASHDSYTTVQGSQLTVTAPGVINNDSDVENSSLTAQLVSGVSHGTLTFNANGSFIYKPAVGYFGQDSFTYKINDGSANSNTATVTINITSSNIPVANSDSYIAQENNILQVKAPGVLSNDTDPNGKILTANIISDTDHGKLTLKKNGSFTYKPDKNFHGIDSFTYAATNGTQQSIGTVTIEVLNNAPTNISLSNKTVLINASQGSKVGLLTAADDAAEPRNFSIISDNSGGAFKIVNNKLVVKDAEALVDTANDKIPVKLTIRDTNSTGLTVDKTFSIQIKDIAPVAKADNYRAFYDVGSPASIAVGAAKGTLSNDINYNPGHSLTAALLKGPAHGTLQLNADGSFTYTAANGFSGVDQFTYQASDGLLTTKGKVSIDVDANPILSGDSNVTYRGNQVVNVLPNGSFSDSDTKSFSGATLKVAFASNGAPNDHLTIMPSLSLFSFNHHIFYNFRLIGTYSGGDGLSPLVISFNERATAAGITKVMQNIGYSNDGAQMSTLDRSVQFVFTNKNGSKSNPLMGLINIQI